MLKLSTSCGALPDRQGQSTTTQQRLLRDAPFRCSSILSPPAETGSTGYCKSDSYMYNAHLTNRTMPIPKHKNIPTSKTNRTNPHKDAVLFSGMSLSEKADTISCRTPRTAASKTHHASGMGKLAQIHQGMGAFVAAWQRAARGTGVAGAVNLPCFSYGFSLSQNSKSWSLAPQGLRTNNLAIRAFKP